MPKPGLSFDSYVFTTHVGCRPAEPCTLSVVATHQILTQLLLYVMYYIRHFDVDDSYATTAGSNYVREEVQELARLQQVCHEDNRGKAAEERIHLAWLVHPLTH